MTVIGNRPEWVLALVACFRIGAVALPCTEQLRAGRPARADGRRRAGGWCSRDERNADTVRDAGFAGTLLMVPDERLFDAAPAPARRPGRARPRR